VIVCGGCAAAHNHKNNFQIDTRQEQKINRKYHEETQRKDKSQKSFLCALYRLRALCG
jgi:hypothetical protein